MQAQRLKAAGIVAQKLGVKIYIAYFCLAFIAGAVCVMLWGGKPSIICVLCVLFMSASYRFTAAWRKPCGYGAGCLAHSQQNGEVPR